MGMMEIVR